MWSEEPTHRRSRKGPWLYIELAHPWIAAFRLEAHGGRPVIAELHVWPAPDAPQRDVPTTVARGDKLVSLGRLPEKSLEGRIRAPAKGAPQSGITKDLLRSIPMDAHLRLSDDAKTRAQLLRLLKAFNVLPEGLTEAELLRLSHREHPRNTRGAHWSDRQYALFAQAYVTRAATSRTPNADLVPEWGATSAEITYRVHQARLKEFLTAAPGRGVAGGSLTRKATKLLPSIHTSTKAKRTKRKGQR